MAITAHIPTVKVVGTNGQISLGKQYAGRQVLVEEYEPGVWLVRTATVVPDNERWLHAPQTAADLQTAMAWSVAHAASDADTEDTLKRLGHGEQSSQGQARPQQPGVSGQPAHAAKARAPRSPGYAPQNSPADLEPVVPRPGPEVGEDHQRQATPGDRCDLLPTHHPGTPGDCIS